MIDIPTVFILGAGASVPYGYPTGAGLRAFIISDFCNRYRQLLKDARIEDPTINVLCQKAEEFVDAFNRSGDPIDRFLSFNSSFADMGKRAIILSILFKEIRSKFREEIGDASQDWYTLLLDRMKSGLTEASDLVKFRDNKVAFITFNYDRSFDHFLYESFLYTFIDSRSQFESLIKEYIPFPIIHVYGQVDKIKWDKGPDYKANYNFDRVEKLFDNIRVIGERFNSKDEIDKIILDNKRIFFLGFGYANENLSAIGRQELVNEGWDIYGTAMGMNEKEIGKVCDVLRGKFPSIIASMNPKIENKTCYELLREYL